MANHKVMYEQVKAMVESSGCTLLTQPDENKGVRRASYRIRCKCGTEFTRSYSNLKAYPFCTRCNRANKLNAKYVEHLGVVLIARVIAAYGTYNPYQIALRIEDLFLPRYKGDYDKLYEYLGKLHIRKPSDIQQLVALYKLTAKRYIAAHPEFVEEIRENLYR